MRTRLRLRTGTKRHRTKKRGVYFVEDEDGTRSYIATWEIERPLQITDPSAMMRRTVEKPATTFEEACRLQAEGEAAERVRHGRTARSPAQRLGERIMAGKWFEYWVRR